ncbi:MAG: phosphoenolpyruvate--protein phosphotransferase [Eubacterium sp.]|nr:phosphoenolpyruvate--protein phosphotransferase [Eubacterium sp.]
MYQFEGKSVYQGIAIGPVKVLKPRSVTVTQEQIADVEAACARVEAAIGEAQQELDALYDKTVETVGEEEAAIFEVHQMMLEDEDYLEAIYTSIREEKMNAAYAVLQAGNTFSEMFAAIDDAYMQARAVDVKDISQRVIRILTGANTNALSTDEPVIIMADDLTPSETMQFEKEHLLAFVTVHGSANSHTAILARTMNLPALVGVSMDLSELTDGTLAIVDGKSGIVIYDPDEKQLEEARRELAKEQAKKELLLQLKGEKTQTKSGKKINLYANIGNVEDVSFVLENDAEGIGLFRSEFLYIGRDALPTEEEQYLAYRQVLEQMENKKVIIRTLDIGADKKADYLGLEEEENPALGYRAIRICLTQTDIFKTQLRALLRAAVHGNLSIMYPMIISVEEVEKIKAIVAEVAAELEAQSVAYRIPEQGIMIETPAAVMISVRLAELVDFFSVGTNDLTQYTLAIDRQNNRLDAFYEPHHEAVLRMIKMAADAAHAAGKWIGICGELGADMDLTEQFIEMGIDELSVAPPMILPLRATIRACE